MVDSADKHAVESADLHDAFYALKPQARRQLVPSKVASAAHIFSIICAIAVAAGLLVVNLSVRRETISNKLLDGWTCTQLTSKSRSMNEIDGSSKCGYSPASESKKSPMNWINYESFQGKSPSSAAYTQYPKCFTDRIPSSNRNLPVWTFRDTYTWGDQMYESHSDCVDSLNVMCKAHQILPLQVPSSTSGSGSISPFYEFGRLYSRPYDAGKSVLNLSPNPRWMLFNGSTCNLVCGTAQKYSLESSITSWKLIELAQSPGPSTINTGVMTDPGPSIAFSSDLSKIVKLQTFGSPVVSTDGGSSFNTFSNAPFTTIAMPLLFTYQTSSQFAVSMSGDGKTLFLAGKYFSSDAGTSWITPSSSFNFSQWSHVSFSENGNYVLALDFKSAGHVVGARANNAFNLVTFKSASLLLGGGSILQRNPSTLMSADGKYQLVNSYYQTSTSCVYSNNFGVTWQTLTGSWVPLTTDYMGATLSGDGQTLVVFSLGGNGDMKVVRNWYTTSPIVQSTSSGNAQLHAFDNVALSFDGSVLAVAGSGGPTTNMMVMSISFDQGITWFQPQPRQSAASTWQVAIKLSPLGDNVVLAALNSNTKIVSIYQSSSISRLQFNSASGLPDASVISAQFNIPTLSYDEIMVVAGSKYMSDNVFISEQMNCKANSQVATSTRGYAFCELSDSSQSSSNHVLSSTWDKQIQISSSLTKPASFGKWTFGSFAFCLNPSFSTCDSQFKAEMCDSGYFQEMMADLVCSKYKTNPPYLCSTGPDIFSAISLSASTAGAVLSGVLTVLVSILVRVYSNIQIVPVNNQQSNEKNSNEFESVEVLNLKHTNNEMSQPVVEIQASSK